MTNTTTSSDRAQSASIGRRRLMQTTAWAVPTTVVAAAAPALATSKPEDPEYPPDHGNPNIGLQGLMNIGKGCPTYKNSGYSLVVNAEDISQDKPVYDEDGKKVQYGFYVLGAERNQTPSNAKFTVYVPTSLGTVKWANRSPNSGWSNLTLDRSVQQYRGFTAYTSTFSGRWFYSVVDGKGRWTAVGPAPAWGACPPNLAKGRSAGNYCPTKTMPAIALRRVDVAGKHLSFQRAVRDRV